MSDHLLAPRALPDGSISWEAQRPEIGRMVRDGDPDTGWLGDERLSLVLNTSFAADHPEVNCNGAPRWEVWRAHEQGEPSLMVWCVTHRIDGHQLCRQLALHDSRTHDIATEMLAARDKRAADLAADHRAENEAGADKLAWALGRDMSAPAQSGRVY